MRIVYQYNGNTLFHFAFLPSCWQTICTRFCADTGTMASYLRELATSEVEQIRQVVWPPSWQATDDTVIDIWFMHDIEFAADCGVGIIQRQNGPCGVLAAIQALMLREQLQQQHGEYFAQEAARCTRAASQQTSPHCRLEGNASMHDMSDVSEYGKQQHSIHVSEQDAVMRQLQANMQYDQTTADRSTIIPPTDQALHRLYLQALCQALCAARESSTDAVRVVLFADQVISPEEYSGYHDLNSQLVVFECLDQAGVLAVLQQHASHFRSAGCLVLVLYSLVATRTCERIVADIDASKSSMFNAWGDVSLVAGDLCFCSHTVVNLVTCGRACFDDPLHVRRADIGFLSAEEMEDGVLGCLVHDHLKMPRYPIWIVGGTGHYSMLFSPQLSATRVPAIRFDSPPPLAPPVPTREQLDSASERAAINNAAITVSNSDSAQQTQPQQQATQVPQAPSPQQIHEPSDVAVGPLRQGQVSNTPRFQAPIESTINHFVLYHYNGLPPAGPRLAQLEIAISVPSNNSAAVATVDNSEWKVPATFISRREAIQSSSNTTEEPQVVVYEYEVAIQRRDDKSEVLEQITQPLTSWRDGEKWRCRDCTMATPTVWSARNDPECHTCIECNKSITECGRCVWLRIEQLPPGKQKEVQMRYAPAIEKLIHTRWFASTVTIYGTPPSL
jgi:hypothetical protein